jgi:hypothetical protein
MKYLRLRVNVPFYITLFACLLIMVVVDIPLFDTITIKDTEARIGRPGTPRSVAGVGRRTTRRTIRRHHVVVGTRVTVLPAGCTAIIKYDVTYYFCGDVYYQPYYEGNDVVYIVVESP